MSNTLRSSSRQTPWNSISSKHARRDRNSGLYNAPHHYRQTLNHKFRVVVRAEIARSIRDDATESLTCTRLVRNANWNWF